jgi:hypothetical protein
VGSNPTLSATHESRRPGRLAEEPTSGAAIESAIESGHPIAAASVWVEIAARVLASTADPTSGRRRGLEFAVIVASGVVALVGFNAMS